MNEVQSIYPQRIFAQNVNMTSPAIMYGWTFQRQITSKKRGATLRPSFQSNTADNNLSNDKSSWATAHHAKRPIPYWSKTFPTTWQRNQYSFSIHCLIALTLTESDALRVSLSHPHWERCPPSVVVSPSLREVPSERLHALETCS